MEKRIKKTYVCRNISDYTILPNVPHQFKVQAGDTGVFEVLQIGKHTKVQADSKQNITIIEGDHIIATFLPSIFNPCTRYAAEVVLPLSIDEPSDRITFAEFDTAFENGIIRCCSSRFVLITSPD